MLIVFYVYTLSSVGIHHLYVLLVKPLDVLPLQLERSRHQFILGSPWFGT